MTEETTDSTEPVAETAAEPAAPRRRLGLLMSVAAVVLVADVVTKVLAVKMLTPGQPVPIIGETVTWTLVRNSGAAFSMATSYTWVLTLIASTVVLGIIWMSRRLVSPWWAVGLGMILGGALGNIRDRVVYGHVIDYADFHLGSWRPFLVFNLADAAITLGVVFILARSFLSREKRDVDAAPAATEN